MVEGTTQYKIRTLSSPEAVALWRLRLQVIPDGLDVLCFSGIFVVQLWGLADSALAQSSQVVLGDRPAHLVHPAARSWIPLVRVGDQVGHAAHLEPHQLSKGQPWAKYQRINSMNLEMKSLSGAFLPAQSIANLEYEGLGRRLDNNGLFAFLLTSLRVRILEQHVGNVSGEEGRELMTDNKCYT